MNDTGLSERVEATQSGSGRDIVASAPGEIRRAMCGVESPALVYFGGKCNVGSSGAELNTKSKK